jgi:hypothetical protein
MTQINNNQSYAATTLNMYNTKTNTNTNANEKLKSLNSYLKNGYSLIKRNPITKKVEITFSNNYESKKKELEHQNYNKVLASMINNWNNYRDELNNLLGDTSPYYNYKETLQKMIDEDNYILEELHKQKHKHTQDFTYDNDSEYGSENEDSKYLLY